MGKKSQAKIICITSHVRYHGAELSDEEWDKIDENKGEEVEVGSLFNAYGVYIGMIDEVYSEKERKGRFIKKKDR
jgi:hypothetical protein